MTNPPWWRPFQRRRYRLWMAACAAEGIGLPVTTGQPAERAPEWIRQMGLRRSKALRDRLNAETDAECVDADTHNGVPFYGMQRALRNKDGEQ